MSHCIAITEFKLELQSGNAQLGQNLVLSHVTLKFDGWPWKTIEHFFYGASSFVHHFIAIIEFKLELQYANPWFRSKSVIFLSPVICKFYRWIWKTIDHLSYTMLSFELHFKTMKLELHSGNAQFRIWWMTLKNKRALLLYHAKLCASFQSHGWIQIGGTVQTGGKRPIWVKYDDLLSQVTLKFDRWPWKTIGHLFYATSSFVHHFIAIVEFKLELQSGNTQFGSNITNLWAMWPWNLMDDFGKR